MINLPNLAAEPDGASVKDQATTKTTPSAPQCRGPRRGAFILPLLAALLLLLPHGARGEEDAGAEALKQKAQQAFLAGRYGEAASANLEIARQDPENEVRRYAVQMLGTIYENNLPNLAQAIKWHREFLERYATPQQVPFYREKLASLEKLRRQDDAFATYQAIRFANKGDEVMVRRFEELLTRHPDFLLKAEVQRELGYAYDRLDQRRKSYRAFQELNRDSGAKASADDRVALQQASRRWEHTGKWGGIAWGVLLALWGALLPLKPWQRLDRAALKILLVLGGVWLLLAALRLPAFYAIDTSGDQFRFPAGAVYLAALLNLPVLFWVTLLTRARLWEGRPRLLLLVSPVLTVLMTVAVFYLFLVHQPNGAKIMEAFGARYLHWAEEWTAAGREGA